MSVFFAYSFFGEFVRLFAEMNIIALLCLLVGIVLCIVEIFQPGFGIFGGLGIVLLLLGIGLRIADNGSIAMLFILTLLIMIVILTAFLFMLCFSKKGWIMRNPQIESGEVEQRDSKDYYFLLNLEGTAKTDLSPSGKIVINDVEFDVVATNGYLEKGSRVKVIEVEGAKVVVKSIARIVK